MPTATNPQTGEKVEWNGTAWVSVGSAPAAPKPMVVGAPRPEKPQVRQVGNQLGVVDSSGSFTPTYTAPEKPEKPDKPNLPVGYRMGPNGVAERIPGIEDPKAAGNPLPLNVANDFQGKVSAFGDLQRAINSFNDGFSGAGAGMESALQGVLPVGTEGQRDWWADFKRTDNITRNVLFGASLSDGEKAAYAETTITPNMRPEEIKRNLQRRIDIARNVLARQKDFLIANGYKPEAIEALMGGMGMEAPAPAAQTQATGQPLAPEQEQELIRILRSQGPEAANAYLQQFGKSLADPAAAAKTPNNSIVYTGAKANELQEQYGEAGVSDLLIHGATLGLSDEAAGVGNALANAVVAPFSDRVNFDPVGAYQQGTEAERARLDAARQNSGWGGTAAEIGGSMLSGNVSGAFAPATALAGRVAQGARAGAASGAIAGFGYGEGPESLLTALGGGAAGAAIGAALPVAGQVIGNRVDGLRRLTGRDPQLPRRIISEAIEADGNTPAVVGQVMDDAATRGSPMMLADTGDNARALLSSVGRQPGPSRTITREAVIPRQQAQTERISSAVARDLGPTANIREMGEELIEQARTAAAPLYEAAYARPGASNIRLDDLATRPSFQRATQRALALAREEGIDPTTLGVQFNEAGDPIITHDRMSWQALDYLKRGLDDVVETYRDKTTGRLVLDNEGRAVNATLRTLIARMDRANPEYAAARAAYAGPARMREALEKGAQALTKSPDDIMAMMRGMGDAEQEAFRMGVRKQIVDMLGTVRDGGDKVARLVGTPKARAVLTRVFGGRGNFERFIQTLRDEEAMGMTYRSVTGNSATAERLAQDQQVQDGGLIEAATESAVRGARNGSMLGGMIADAFDALQNAGRFGAGQAGQRARESVAALLTETDPAVLRELIRAANQAAARQRAVTANRGRKAVTQGRNVGALSGLTAGQTTKQPR